MPYLETSKNVKISFHLPTFQLIRTTAALRLRICFAQVSMVSFIALLALLFATNIKEHLAASNYCGASFLASLDCHRPCPNGADAECLNGETCFAGINCGEELAFVYQVLLNLIAYA